MNDITTKYYLPQMTIRQLDNGNLQRCKKSRLDPGQISREQSSR